MRAAAGVLLVVVLAACSGRPSAAARVSEGADELSSALDEARAARRALESAEILIGGEVAACARSRVEKCGAWASTLREIRGALKAARSRETDLALLAE